MGNTYETDGVEKRDEIALALQAAVAVKSLGNLIGCRSWLQARLALREVRQRVDELGQTVARGGMPNARLHPEPPAAGGDRVGAVVGGSYDSNLL